MPRETRQSIGPRFVQVWDDPAGDGKAAGMFFGSYRTDDEAVAAERVKVITDGVLTALLTSRTPSRPQPLSNGHGRGGATAGAVRGQAGVLVVSAGAAAVADHKLVARALVQARALGKGTPVYVVRTLSSGAEMSTLRPLEVYRVLANGERQRVRGLVLRNLSSGSLRDIVALGRRPYVYNYVSPRSSFEGSAPPTTVIAPAIILDRVEVQRDPRQGPRPPLYPHPFFGAAFRR